MVGTDTAPADPLTVFDESLRGGKGETVVQSIEIYKPVQEVVTGQHARNSIDLLLEKLINSD